MGELYAGRRVVILFFGHYLPYDRVRGFGIAKRMATVRADRRIDWHSNVRLVHGAFLRCGEQKNFAAHGREGARSHGMNMRSDPAGSPNREPQEKKQWVEPVAAILMALATLSTAWCSFESAAWTRQSNRLMNEFNALERKAGLLTMQGTQHATIHAAMFMQLLAAQQAGNEKLVNFYVERFPPDVRKAYGSGRRVCESCQQPAEGRQCGEYFRSVPREYCSVRHSAFLRQRVDKVRAAAGACSGVHLRCCRVRVCAPADVDASDVRNT